MAGTVTARLERLEPRAVAAWHRAWEHFAVNVERAMPEARHELAARIPDDEDAWRDFYAQHGLNAMVEWSDKNPVVGPADPDTVDFTMWPSSIPLPPPEPSGAWDRLQQLEQGDGDEAASAALALLLLAFARCVRETRS